jgi:hypothetical protein
VNWDTTKKTTGFTAVNGVGYFCDTTSSAFTMTLPATPSAGDIVALKDYANTFDTNNLTIDRNGSNINGSAANGIISVQGQALTLIYIDATQGWSAIYGATDADLPAPEYVAATGGTILTCGDFKTHVFTGPGTFTVSNAGNPLGSDSVEYLVVAGGGGAAYNAGGGGGAGGYRQNYPSPTTGGLPVTAQGYPITVGGGGAAGDSAGPPTSEGVNGSNSVFSTITSSGGGGGGRAQGPLGGVGKAGGSGGGAMAEGVPTKSGGTGNTPPTSPSQGNNGGTAPSSAGAGGGGASAVGGNASGINGGPGGAGSPIATTFFGPTSPSYGTPGPASGRYFAGGGGGSAFIPGGTSSTGGDGGGGTGALNGGDPGDTNTGGGGGANNFSIAGGNSGAGGSGIVVIRYKFQ